MIPLHWHDEIDSTSDWAAREIAAVPPSAPFAVASLSQNKGRGQRQRSWSSEPGNLHLSIVLPANFLAERPGAQGRAQLPQRVGVFIARWLAREFACPIAVKWPNDLLCFGRKVGGILCETSIQGTQLGPIVIGVGINLVRAPTLGNGEPAATTLVAVAGAHGPSTARLLNIAELAQRARMSELGPNVREVAQMLAHDFVSSLADSAHGATSSPADGLSRDVLALTPLALGWWFRRSPPEPAAFFRLNGVAGDGALLLEPLEDSAAVVRVSSADQSGADGFRPVFQVRCGEASSVCALLTADVGNSRIKLAIWKAPTDEKPIREIAAGPDEDSALTKFIALAKAEHGCRVTFGVSVNPVRAARLTSLLEAADIACEILPKRRCLSVGDYPTTQLGADRLAGIEGALADFESRDGRTVQGQVVVSVGTATTIDLLAGREHRGGWIIPGPRLALQCLAQGTAELPDFARAEIDPGTAPGISTATAMQRGSLLFTVAAIARSVRELSNHPVLTEKGSTNAAVRVLVTGGDGEQVARVLAADGVWTEWRPHLIHSGARAMALGGAP